MIDNLLINIWYEFLNDFDAQSFLGKKKLLQKAGPLDPILSKVWR